MMNLHGLRTEVRNHGGTQLEIKNHYPISSADIDHYVLDVWLYTPISLGINSREDSVPRFLSDVRSLTRFSSSVIPIARLTDKNCDISPLVRIRKELSSASLSRDIRDKRILYELRSLANIYNSETTTSELIIADALKHGRMNLVKDTIKKNLKDIKDFLDAWRSLYSLFLMPAVSPTLRDAYSWTDESISLITEQVLYDLHRHINPDDEAPSLIKRINKLMETELTHRRAMGYHTISPETNAKETEKRIYRESTLKKWSQSALYLTQEQSGTGRRMSHVLAGVAAATAMSFAVAATLLAERYFPGQSLPWAITIVVAYIFKDRIKEGLRGILAHTLPGLVIDQRISLIDQVAGKKVGRVTSRVRFLGARGVPPTVARLRNVGGVKMQQILPEEDVVHFRREIIMHNRRLRESHTRLDTISDIIRFKLERLLVNMDDPKKSIPTFVSGDPRMISGNRVYHINMVVCLSRKGDEVGKCSRYRLVMCREGLIRIETVVKPSGSQF